MSKYEKECRKTGMALCPEEDDPKMDAEEREADKKEFAAIPVADVQLSHFVSGGAMGKAKRDSYEALVKFDPYLTKLKFRLDDAGNQFAEALLNASGKTFIPNQTTLRLPVRMVRVHYAGRAEGDPETVVPYCELFLAPGLVLSQRLDLKGYEDFLKLFKLDLRKDVDGFARKWAWFDRDAVPSEKPADPAAEEETK